jgi:hypothetical protein
LWSKFWTGLVPTLLMAETLTVLSNEFLGTAVFLKVLAALAIFFMTFSLVGLAAGMGAQHPRFGAENITQVAGSYGGVAFMILAVLFILVEVTLLAWPAATYLYWTQYREQTLPLGRQLLMAASLVAALAVAVVTFWVPMQRGVRALERLAD